MYPEGSLIQFAKKITLPKSMRCLHGKAWESMKGEYQTDLIIWEMPGPQLLSSTGKGRAIFFQAAS